MYPRPRRAGTVTKRTSSSSSGGKNGPTTGGSCLAPCSEKVLHRTTRNPNLSNDNGAGQGLR